jgi:sugar O-acyltransferase (sialic acid O-acetyltransferase NeuD family)
VKDKIIIIGGGSHARSILALIKKNRLFSRLLGYTDTIKSNISIKYLGKDEEILKTYDRKNTKLALGIGINTKLRKKIINKFRGYQFLSLVDQDAIIYKNCNIDEGSIVFPGAIIGPNVKIGSFCVVHHSVVLEHDVEISQNSYIGPGAVVCGNAKIGENVLIGANSTMIEKTFIQKNSKLGAGSVLINSFKSDNKSLIGIPAKIKK